ncbi:MAG: cell wall-binding repeat-containing protein [Solirubrobacteraceae bacterium]
MRARPFHAARRSAMPAVAGLLALALTACGGGTKLLRTTVTVSAVNGGISAKTPQAAQKLGFPAQATKNTTRVAGTDPVADAAGVAVAVYPSAAPGTHPSAVALAPTNDWPAALAASVLMAPPIRAPVLLSGSGSLPAATATALTTLAPTGSGSVGGARVIRIGSVPSVTGLHSTAIAGTDPYALAAGIDRFVSAVAGRPSSDVVIASATNPAYAMPAAGWAAESGNPILFVGASGVPAATRQALLAHSKPHIYVLGPPNVIPDATLTQLGKFGTVKRISGADPAATSVAFATYRDPACVFGQPCAHVPNSFGWALRSPGHGYVLLNASRPLDAAAAAALSGSGDYGPGLVVENASTLPKSVLNYFLDYATPGFTQEGPTAAVYNHGWMIGDQSAISVSVQAEVDRLLEAVAQGGQG